MTRQRRRRAWLRGRRAEWMAAWWLRFKGYRIVVRNFRVAAGEIDLVARRGKTLAMIEVKTRGDFATASESLSGRQRRRISRAAEAFLQQRPGLAHLAVRFDVILVAPNRFPRHLLDAWRPERTT